jgi:hypothetical protein
MIKKAANAGEYVLHIILSNAVKEFHLKASLCMGNKLRSSGVATIKTK